METPKPKTPYEEGLGIRFDTIEQLLRQTTRRLDSMQKTDDLIFADRSILEDIVIQVGALKSMIVMGREHQENMIKSLLSDVSAVKTHVSEGLGDITQAIDDKEMISVKDPSIMEKIKEKFEKKK